MNKGVVSAAIAYFMWGLFPLYWRLIANVPSLEILAHRMTWSLVFLVALLAVQRNWSWIRPAVRERNTVLTFFAASAILAVNWGTYIWGVNAGYVVETSLGYFINPLLNVCLGVLFLGERLRRAQWIAVVLAGLGVLWLTFDYGRPPYIALVLAFSFGIYGLLKKRTKLPAIEGLALETALMFLPAFGFLVWLQWQGEAAFGTVDVQTTTLLALAGVATSVPLLFFAYGAQRIQLATLGLLQYIAPTLQFLCGVFVFNEAFDRGQLVGFVLIWTALAVFSAETLTNYRRTQPATT